MRTSVFAIRGPQEPDALELARLHLSSWKETYSHLLPEGDFTSEYLEQREGPLDPDRAEPPG